jgi:hypothetical protein
MGSRDHGVAMLLYGRRGFLIKYATPIGGLDKNRGGLAPLLVLVVVPHARAGVPSTAIQQRLGCSCLRGTQLCST